MFSHILSIEHENCIYFNPYILFVVYMRHSDKILILNKEGIIEENSYERRAYESVDEKSLS